MSVLRDRFQSQEVAADERWAVVGECGWTDEEREG